MAVDASSYVIAALLLALPALYLFVFARKPSGDSARKREERERAFPLLRAEDEECENILGIFSRILPARAAHALMYKKDAAGTLKIGAAQVSTKQKSGTHRAKSLSAAAPAPAPAGFSLHLGPAPRFYVATSSRARRELLGAPEHVLSQKLALEKLGIGECLGSEALGGGTLLHRELLLRKRDENTSTFCSAPEPQRSLAREPPLVDAYGIADEFRAVFGEALERALRRCNVASHADAAPVSQKQQPSGTESEEFTCDLFQTVRTAAVDACVRALLGGGGRAVGGSDASHAAFCDAFWDFQERYEDAIAASLVAPRIISTRLRARVAALRVKLEETLCSDFERVRTTAKQGDASARDETRTLPYVDALRTAVDARTEISRGGGERELDRIVAARFVALLTAAPKNFSIVASQTILSRAAFGAVDSRGDGGISNSSSSSSSNDPLADPACVSGSARERVTGVLARIGHSLGPPRVVVGQAEKRKAAGNGANLGTAERGERVLSCLSEGAMVFASPFLQQDAARAAGQSDKKCAEFAFGGGAHRCPGAALGTTLSVAIVEHVENNLDVQLAVRADPLPSLSFVKATVAQREGPISVLFKKRRNIPASVLGEDRTTQSPTVSAARTSSSEKVRQEPAVSRSQGAEAGIGGLKRGFLASGKATKPGASHGRSPPSPDSFPVSNTRVVELSDGEGSDADLDRSSSVAPDYFAGLLEKRDSIRVHVLESQLGIPLDRKFADGYSGVHKVSASALIDANSLELKMKRLVRRYDASCLAFFEGCSTTGNAAQLFADSVTAQTPSLLELLLSTRAEVADLDFVEQVYECVKSLAFGLESVLAEAVDSSETRDRLRREFCQNFGAALEHVASLDLQDFLSFFEHGDQKQDCFSSCAKLFASLAREQLDSLATRETHIPSAWQARLYVDGLRQRGLQGTQHLGRTMGTKSDPFTAEALADSQGTMPAWLRTGDGSASELAFPAVLRDRYFSEILRSELIARAEDHPDVQQLQREGNGALSKRLPHLAQLL